RDTDLVMAAGPRLTSPGAGGSGNASPWLIEERRSAMEGPAKIGVYKVAMAAPNDVSGLAALIDSGEVDPGDVIALIGKTEGNGGANDFTRGYATLSYQLLLGRHLGMSPEKVGARIAFVWSGGTEGVLSPHATIFTRS